MNQLNSASGPTSGLVALGNSPIRISRHAIDRYFGRVDPTADRSMALQAIAAMLTSGTVRMTPRWWTTCRLAPGTRLVYAAVNPDVCLVVKDGTVVTLITRALCAPAHSQTGPHSGIKVLPNARSRREFVDDVADIYEPLPEDLAWVA